MKLFSALGPPLEKTAKAGAMRASSLYRADLWSAALAITRLLPDRASEWISARAALLYWRLNRRSRQIVIANLAPALGGNDALAFEKSRDLFREFARKLIDLWRFENGTKINHLFHDWKNWDRYLAARQRRGGVLLLTPHLGNWEFGGPLLIERGVSLQVITLTEPAPRLTRLREKGRSRWGIETLVIGDDPFAFVEVIRRLEGGATTALLIDRPPPASAVEVRLFGKPFLASIAAAELARATGCALLPVCLPRDTSGYTAQMLPEIQYDRRALGSREARQALTQEILRAFEPLIQQYITQWFHFVPIWPSPKDSEIPRRP